MHFLRLEETLGEVDSMASMVTTFRAWLGLCWVALLFSCGGGLERASFMTDQLEYARGSRVALTLTNVSSAPIGINLCLSQLITADFSGKGQSPAPGCSLEQIPLAPGSALDARKLIPTNLVPGQWRYQTTIVLASGAGETVFTAPFTVRP